MKIMSFNLRFAHNADHNQQKEREPRVAAFIRQQQPASVGFQETEPFWRERLDEVLTGYQRVQPQMMTKNYIYFNPAQLKVINHGVIWLSETPDVPSRGFGSKYFISATWAIFEKLDDMNFTFEQLQTKLLEIGSAITGGGMPEAAQPATNQPNMTQPQSAAGA